MISFRLLNRDGLKHWIDSEESNSLSILPITRHRAISQINNPGADKEDILLILAFLQGALVGYAGVLPDHLHLSDGKILKVGWLSGLYVHENARGQGLGVQLIGKALDCYDQRILSADYVPATKGLYDKTGAFGPPTNLEGIRLYLRMDLSNILPPKRQFFGRIKPILRAIDEVVNLFTDLRFHFIKVSFNERRNQYLTSFDNEVVNFIKESTQHKSFRRGAAELQWILQFPWILQHEENVDERGAYHFSSRDASFINKAVKLVNVQGELESFILFTSRKGNIKVPYCFCSNEGLNLSYQFLRSVAINLRANSLTIFQPELRDLFMTKSSFALYKKKVFRYYLISRKLLIEMNGEDFEPGSGDGDVVFT